VGRNDARRAAAHAFAKAAIRPDFKTCSGMISTRLRQRHALPVVCARGRRRVKSAATRPVVQQGPPLTSLAAPQRRQGGPLAPAEPVPRGAIIGGRAGGPNAGTAGNLNRKHTPYLRLQCANGKLVSEKPQKHGTKGPTAGYDSP